MFSVFHKIATDTLAFGYVLGTTNPHLGLSPLRLRLPGALTKITMTLLHAMVIV